MKYCKFQTGMTLLEVMIAVFVLSIGLIGIAKLQVTSKQNNFDAVQRITATNAAYDLIERMRNNPEQLAEYVNNNGTRTIIKTSMANEPTPVCGGTSTTCDAQQLALHDLWEIKELLRGATEMKGNAYTGGLDEFTACISGPNTGAAGVYTIAIAWRGRTALSNPGGSTCGDTTGFYGNNNEYRRVVQFVTFIDDQVYS